MVAMPSMPHKNHRQLRNACFQFFLRIRQKNTVAIQANQKPSMVYFIHSTHPASVPLISSVLASILPSFLGYSFK